MYISILKFEVRLAYMMKSQVLIIIYHFKLGALVNMISEVLCNVIV